MSDNSKIDQDHAVYSNILKSLYAAFKNIRLYSPSHPSAQEASRQLISGLDEFFRNRFEISIQNNEAIFIINDDYFIEESLSFYELLHSLELLKINRVVFLPGVTKMEIVDFCVHLQKNSKEVTGAPSLFASEHIRNHANVTVIEIQKRKESGVNLERARAVTDEWLTLADTVTSKILEEQTLGGGDLSHALDNLIDHIHQIPASFSILLAMTPPGRLLVEHSVHTMIQSIFVGIYMGYDLGSLKNLALAALLHDIGRQLLPSEFTTGTAISTTDAGFLHLHVRDGASLLTGVQGVPFSVVRVALEHHIGTDGFGYPFSSQTHKRHPFSLIVSATSFMSWGTVSDAVYHKPAPMHRRIASLIRRAGTQFDPFVVKFLVPFFGLYPPGTKVRLDTGEKAVVLVPSTDNILRPVVAIDKGSGSFQIRHLAGHPGGQPGFKPSIEKAIGWEPNIAPLIEIIPDDLSDSI